MDEKRLAAMQAEIDVDKKRAEKRNKKLAVLRQYIRAFPDKIKPPRLEEIRSGEFKYPWEIPHLCPECGRIVECEEVNMFLYYYECECGWEYIKDYWPYKYKVKITGGGS